MRLKKTHCVNCGSMLDLQVDEYHSRVFCPYCGQVYEVDHHRKEISITQNVNITERYTDDAAVIRAKQKDRESKYAWVYAAVPIGFLFLVLVCMLTLPVLTKGIAQRQGKISAGWYYDYGDLQYEAAELYLTELGFTNIVLIDLNDAEKKGKNDGEVESITINGDSRFDRDDYFYPTDKVIILYH